MKFDRASGVLMHIASLPGNSGIGTLGKAAYDFVDFLKNARQTYWQILPVCPTSYGDSPYQSFSTFAGNPYFIDLDFLCRDGFLWEEEYRDIDWGQDETQVDYGLLYIRRHELFQKVQQHFRENPPADFKPFCAKNAFWLDDYALFMAIKDAHGGIAYSKWEDDIRTKQPDVTEMWRVKCSERVQYYKMLQYFFFKQWFALKRYAHQNGVRIIGDIPIYVAADSADVWADPRQFSLDENGDPIEVAGCPPDAFSQDGQLWGNPVYDWEYMRRTKYRWWLKRLQMSLQIYDVIRIDHFRGFDEYYCIPYGAKTARTGVWHKGPGMRLWDAVHRHLGDIPVIAEDLGYMTDSVLEMVKESGFPGMNVLQFAFDHQGNSRYLTHRYTRNSVVYTGTHDNDTIRGWMQDTSEQDLDFAQRYLQADDRDDIPRRMMLAGMASVADICILTMQDLIGLGKEARINIPSTVGTNWRWRATKEQIVPAITEKWAYYTGLYDRVPVQTNIAEDKYE